MSNFDQVVTLAGLDGLDALGRRRLRKLIAKRRAVRPFRGSHAALLNELPELDGLELAGLDELGSLRKKIKKVGKKVKKASPVLLNFVPGVGTALSLAAGAALAAEAKKKAKKKNAAAQAAADKEADAIVSRMQSGGGASAPSAPTSSGSSGSGADLNQSLVASGAQSFAPDDGSSSLVEGEYIPAGEKSEAEKQVKQWFPFISNRNLLLLSGAGVLTLVLVESVRGRRRAA